MKKLYCLYISLLLLALTACHDKPKPLHPALVRAERLLSLHPDSALHVLARYRLRSFSDSADMAAYALLRTQAEDKNYITHTSDSLIRIAVGYYSRHGDSRHKALAHYYLGRVYQDKGDDVNTVKQFLRASNFIGKNTDDSLSCLIKNNYAYLLMNYSMYKEAESLYHELFIIFMRMHDYQRLAVVYTNLGNIAMTRGRKYYLLAEQRFKLALKFNKINDNTSIRLTTLSGLAHLYTYMQSYSLAIDYIKQGLLITSSENERTPFYLMMGKVYKHINQDSLSCLYYSKCLNSSNLWIRKEAFDSLCTFPCIKNNSVLFQDYMIQSSKLKDKLMNDDCTAEVINLIKTDEAKRNVSTVNRNYAIGSVIIVLVFLFAVLVFSLNYKKRKRNRDHLKAENDILSKFQSESDFVTSDIYLLFHDPKAKTTARDFILLEQSLNHTYSNFTIRLKQKYPKMTTVELQICCLVKIGLSVKDLTRYYPYSRANYTMIRSRLYKKITGKEGNGKDFDDYILHF